MVKTACNAGDAGLILGLGGPLEKWQPTPVFLLENSLDRGAWQAPWRRKESDMTEQLTLSLSLYSCNIQNEADNWVILLATGYH